jgi:hypothetical protein
MTLPYFLHFCDYPRFEEDLDQIWIPIIQEMFVPSLIEIGQMIQFKKILSNIQ